MMTVQRANADLFEALYQNFPDGIAVLDLASRFLSANPAYLAMTGFSSTALLQTSCLDLTAPEDKKRAEAALALVRREGYVRDFEKTCIVEDGQRIQVSMSLTLMPDRQQILVVTKNVTEKTRFHPATQRQVTHDVLTGLPNRVLLHDRLTRAIVRAQRQQGLLAVCAIDLDKFKPINQRWGSYVGDRILLEIARRLQIVTRDDDTVARLGGDEFVLLLGNLSGQDALFTALDSLLQILSQPFHTEDKIIELSASIGCALYPVHDDDTDLLLRHADQAMYQAKQQGRNQYKMFDVSHDAALQHTHQLVKQVGQALHAGELVLFYQPKVNMRTGEVFGLEALLRWQHPSKGMIPPLDFLPQIEQTDLIVDIGEWVIEQALQQIAVWQAAGKDWSVSVNIAARHFQRADFLLRLQTMLASCPKSVHERLEIELLESVALGDIEQVNQQIRAIQVLGVSFSLDDFGTGYSSLSYLKHLPTETIKIDRTFVRDILEDKNDLALIEAIIGMGRAFNRKLVAEGVETVAHGVLLIRLGCELAQGYGISKPMPATQVLDWAVHYQVDPLWQKWADVRWEISDFPLVLAQYDYIEWVNRLLVFVDARQIPEDHAEIDNEYRCRFGQWYGAQRNVLYRQLPEFAAIGEVHHQVHDCAKQLVDAVTQQDERVIRAQRKRLLTLKSRLLVLLEALQFSLRSACSQCDRLSAQTS